MHIVCVLPHVKSHCPSSLGGQWPEYAGEGKNRMFQKDGENSSTQSGH